MSGDELLHSFDDGDSVSITVGSLKLFLDQVRAGIEYPSLAFSHNGIKHEARVSVTPRPWYENDDVICDITWLRDDVLEAVDHVYDIALDRDDEGVEDMIDGVVDEIGHALKDRSTEFGFDLIYDFLPGYDEIAKLARGESETVPTVVYDSPATRERYTLALYSDRYDCGGLAVGLVSTDVHDEDFGETWGMLTVNLPGNPVASGWCTQRGKVILDSNDNPQALIDALADAGIVELSGMTARSGFCDYPLATISSDTLANLRGYEETIARIQQAQGSGRGLAQPSPNDVSDAARNVAREVGVAASGAPSIHR